MINVISSEYYKIFKSKLFYITSIILLSLTFISLVASVKTQPKGEISGYQEFFNVDMIFYIILIFVSCQVTGNYTNGSIKQMACHGIPRWKLVVGQYIANSSLITLIFFSFSIINLLIDLIMYQSKTLNAAIFIPMHIGLMCMFWGIAGIGTFLSYLFKNSGITVAISILLIMSQNFIARFFSLLTGSSVFLKYLPSTMRSIITDLTSKPEDIVICSAVFLFIGIITTAGSCLLFLIRDIN